MCMNFYTNYTWKKGRPRGVGKEMEVGAGLCFKVIADPYYKRISVEKYEDNKLIEVIYDSALFDFRHLKQEDAAWQREVIDEEKNTTRSLVRSIDDRVIFIEVSEFKDDKCICCQILSPHGVPVAKQTIFDELRGDSWNGVQLCDMSGKVILRKKYAKDPLSGDFGELLEEQWES